MEEPDSDENDSNCDSASSSLQDFRTKLHFKLLASSKDNHPTVVLRIGEDGPDELLDSDDIYGEYQSPEFPEHEGTLEKQENLLKVVEQLFSGMYLGENQQWKMKDSKIHGDWSVARELLPHELNKLGTAFGLSPLHQVAKVSKFRAGFLLEPSLSNGAGRSSMVAILEAIQSLMPEDLAINMAISNIGGVGAYNAWPGCSSIGYIYDLDPRDHDLLKNMQESACQRSRTRWVPDFQITNPCRGIHFLTGEVECASGISELAQYVTCHKQAWEQALAGLRNMDESYSILMTPGEAILFKLSIEDPRPGSKLRRLMTHRRIYNLYQGTKESVFNVNALKLFLTDIRVLLYSFAKRFQDMDHVDSFAD